MMTYIWWSLPLTLAVFFAARRLAAHFKMPLLNPLLVAMVVIIPFLLPPRPPPALPDAPPTGLSPG